MNYCYVLLSEWCVDYESGHEIVGVYDTEAKAITALKNRVDSDDRVLAEDYGYTIYEDSDVCFDAGEEGEYVSNHVCARIERAKRTF